MESFAKFAAGTAVVTLTITALMVLSAHYLLGATL